MLHDLGSRDHRFISINRRMRERLLAIVNGGADLVCVPLQGSGTFVVEAMLGTFVPPTGKLLVLVNGAYGKRMLRMCEYYRRAHTEETFAEDQPCDPGVLDRRLSADPGDHARCGRLLRNHVGRAEPDRRARCESRGDATAAAC